MHVQNMCNFMHIFKVILSFLNDGVGKKILFLYLDKYNLYQASQEMLLFGAWYQTTWKLQFALSCMRSSDILEDCSPLILKVQIAILDCLALKVKALQS
jgi:hypothetical protein